MKLNRFLLIWSSMAAPDTDVESTQCLFGVSVSSRGHFHHRQCIYHWQWHLTLSGGALKQTLQPLWKTDTLRRTCSRRAESSLPRGTLSADGTRQTPGSQGLGKRAQVRWGPTVWDKDRCHPPIPLPNLLVPLCHVSEEESKECSAHSALCRQAIKIE